MTTRGAGDGPEATLLGRVQAVKGEAGLFLAILVLAGCAGGGLRAAPPGSGTHAVQELPSLRVRVEVEAWRGRPRWLPESVLPFLVSLRNTGSRPIAVARDDFALLDDANRQYAPLPPAEVVSLLGGAPGGVHLSPSIGVSGSSGGGGTMVGGGLGIAFGSARETRDVIPLALAEATIQPGAEVRGFLYFPNPSGALEELRLIVAPRDLSGRPRLEFHFVSAR